MWRTSSVLYTSILESPAGYAIVFYLYSSENAQLYKLSYQNDFFAVEKAALVFSLKLDNGHKLLCPWIDNACSETLTRFPPISPPVLVDNFRERCSALLQLSALPRISSSVIDHMQSPLLGDFLEQSLLQECGNESAGNSGIEDVDSQEKLKLYYQVITGFPMVKISSTTGI